MPLFDIDTAASRIGAARAAIDKAGGDTVLVGRAECFLVGRPDVHHTLLRLKRYAEAGADCLYAPGLRTPEEIAAVVAAVAPKPVNLLVGCANGLTMEQVAALGARRSARQRGRYAGTLGMGCVCAGRPVNCRARAVRWVHQRAVGP